MSAEPQVRVVLRPLGSALPLGFLALAAATTLVSALQLGWLRAELGPSVALVLIAFVAPLQLITSVLGFLSRDAVVGTGMGLLAGTWVSVGLVMRANGAGSTDDALGVLLLVASAAMLVPAAGAAAGKLVPCAVLTTTALRFLLTGVYEITAGSTSRHAAAVVGLALGALAFYAALALMLEEAGARPRLPLGRRGAGRSAVSAGAAAQVSGVHHEAGVRRQL